jgi:hypothetical protein
MISNAGIKKSERAKAVRKKSVSCEMSRAKANA